MSKTFDEELREILATLTERVKPTGDFPNSEAHQTAHKAIKALIKKHQPENSKRITKIMQKHIDWYRETKKMEKSGEVDSSYLYDMAVEHICDNMTRSDALDLLEALSDSDKAYGLEDYSCEICGADPMTVDCNNANCDIRKDR